MSAGRTPSGLRPALRPADHRWLIPLVFFASTLLAACGGGGGGGSSGSDPTSSISGTASKGPVAGAQVFLYRAGSDGGPDGSPVAGPFVTDAQGNWAADVSNGLPRPLVVVASGGSYTDEATASTVDMTGRSLRSYLPEDADTVAITPLTDLLVQLTRDHMAANPEAGVSVGLNAARNTLSQALSFNFDPLRTRPLDIADAGSGDRDQRAYTAVLAGLSQLANSLAPTADPFDTVKALMDDMSDGTLDGEKDGEPIPIGDSENSLPTTDSNAFASAINTAITNSGNEEAFGDVSVSIDDDGNVTVSPRFTVGGSVSGLAGGGLILQINGGDDLEITEDGDFTFGGFFDGGDAYEVTVLTQPTSPSQTCTISTGTGEMGDEDVTTVAVSCDTDNFTIGGTVSGLDEGQTLVLQNNGADSLEITANGAFDFDTAIADLQTYAVTVLTQPANGQICAVRNASGSLDGAAVTDVDVSCSLINVSISLGEGSVSTQSGQVSDGSLILILQPGEGYMVGDASVTGEGCSGVLEGNVYTVSGLNGGSCDVTVEFEEAPDESAVWGQFNWGEANWQ